MRFVVTLRDGSPAGSQTEVLVDADPRSPLSQLLPRLLAAFDDGTHPSFASGVQVWVNGVAIDEPDERTLASAGLRPGAIVELHTARERPAQQPSGVAEIRVVNGPGAGRVHRLTLGHTVAGFDAPGMGLADRQLPAHALTIIATAGGQVDVEPVAGVVATLDGDEITTRQAWPLGAYLVAGRTVLELAPVSTAVASPGTSDDGDELTVAVIRPPKPPITPPGGWPVSVTAAAPSSGGRSRPGVDAATTDGPDDGTGPGDGFGPGRADRTALADGHDVHGRHGRHGAVDAGPEPAMADEPDEHAREDRRPRARSSSPRGWRWTPVGRTPTHRQEKARQERAGRSSNVGAASAGPVALAEPRSGAADQTSTAPSRIEQARMRRRLVPDPAQVLLSTVAQDASVWHRFPGDDDFLRLRIGLSDRDGLPDVPVWADLPSVGVLGIAGDQETAHGLAAWLLGQCAVLQSPQQVRLAVLTTNQYQSRRRWEWLMRVPHSAPGGVAASNDDPEPPVVALVGTDDESIGRRLAELSGLISDRRLVAATSSKAMPAPRVVVLLDGTRHLRGRAGLTELLTDGPDAGVYTICIEEDENWLPPGCREVITCTPRDARLQTGRDSVRPDQVEPAWSDELSRLLAPLRDTSPAPEPSAAPDGGLLRMLGMDASQAVHTVHTAQLEQLEQLAAAHWSASPSGRVVIGTAHDGPFSVDLRLDGPHLLVAGEPEARPEAMLSVVLASLAAANRPDHLNAIIISTGDCPELAACAALPHVTGSVNLSGAEGHSTPPGEEPLQRLQRALAGISAELDHRDALLSRVGARDIEDYAARATRLPRLLVAVHDVVDLAEQLPGGLAELVSAAQRGESLGLNLLMGTSRPEDIASHDIASVLSANATLRICLRVGSEAASRVVIDSAEAARIPRRTQGRGFARTGHWPLLSFQAPRLGSGAARATPVVPGRNRDAAPSRGDDPANEPLAWALPWDDAVHPAPGRATEIAAGTERTTALAAELTTLATATQAAASSLMIPAPQPPWLPPLPRVIQSAAVRSHLRPAVVDLTDPVGAPHPWALEEHPDTQTRSVSSIELGRSGHLLLSGAPGSGRTTALRTITGVLADRVSSADLHIYAIDCGDGALQPLDELPHLGAMVRRSERARAGRVLGQLVEEVAARRETLTAHNWADVEEQRAIASSADRLPYLMLLVDRWESLATGPDGGTLTEQVLVLLRRGAVAGLHVVIAGDRSLLSGRVNTLAVPCLLLQPDAVAYRLAGLKPGAQAAAATPPGRGVWADSGVQVQVCVLSADASAQGQNAAIEDVARRRARRNAGIPESLRPVRL